MFSSQAKLASNYFTHYRRLKPDQLIGESSLPAWHTGATDKHEPVVCMVSGCGYNTDAYDVSLREGIGETCFTGEQRPRLPHVTHLSLRQEAGLTVDTVANRK
ncbi:hypothetical protein RRG08_006097 [Elysia crispata]|uniref:Uncharacterized protein n=1 Tax=Elysia crispata TaxID=231223 RepID=A0AAE1AC56_9GAST|nr:hypothetical protein RRG08_006097 [Elysia crispata]